MSIVTTNQGLSHIAFKSIIDSIDDIFGNNGKNAILKYAGIDASIITSLEYDTEKKIGIEDTTNLFMSIRDLMGTKGYSTLMYRGGILNINYTLELSEELRRLIDLEVTFDEKLNQVYSAYIESIGLFPDEALEFFPEKREILIHKKPYCNECEFVKNDKAKLERISKPGCSHVLGKIHQMGNIRPDLGSVTAEEIKCALIGDNECLFVVHYEFRYGNELNLSV
jgi:hypothetical protein